MPGDCHEGTTTTVDVESDSTQLYLTLQLQGQWVKAGNVTLREVLEYRAEGIPMMVEAGNPTTPIFGLEPLPPFVIVPQFAFFIYDHLGNTRVLYSNDLIECNPDSTKYILEHVLDYYPYGRTLRDYVWKRERFQTTYHERDLESGLDYRGARFYDGDIGRFLSVDPMAEQFASWSTYHYTYNNPIRFIDPDGRSADDIVFNAVKEDGSRVEVGRIVTDKFDVEFNIDAEKISGLGLEELEPISIDGDKILDRNAQAVSLDVSGEAAFKVGVQGQVSLFGMIDGPDKGQWGVGLQVNGLVGLEGGVTATISAYKPLGDGDLLLNDLKGWEYGVQGDMMNSAASYFRGRSYPLSKDTYEGVSIGATVGVLPTWGSASGYVGYSDFIYRTYNRP